jgi:hypothetical protein
MDVEHFLWIAAHDVEAAHQSRIEKEVHLSILDIREGRFLRQLLRQEDRRRRSDKRSEADSRLKRGQVQAYL